MINSPGIRTPKPDVASSILAGDTIESPVFAEIEHLDVLGKVDNTSAGYPTGSYHQTLAP